MSTWAIQLPVKRIYQAFDTKVKPSRIKNGGKRKVRHYTLTTTCKYCMQGDIQEGENLDLLKIRSDSFKRDHLDDCPKKPNQIRFV
jgi:hypothetical protein